MSVDDAQRLSEAMGFTASCERSVGQLLAVLAAAAPHGARVLELGTGVGMGTSWLVSGLGARTDVSVISVERDAELVAAARSLQLPAYVQLFVGDVEAQLPGLGQFDLIFADAEGGKWTRLDVTLDALKPGGLLLLDDMDSDRYEQPEHQAAIAGVRQQLAADARLLNVELPTGSGMILATRRHSPAATRTPAAPMHL